MDGLTLPSCCVQPPVPVPPPCSANVSPPSLAADMLCGAFNVIAFSWIASPAATELEAVSWEVFGGNHGCRGPHVEPATRRGLVAATADLPRPSACTWFCSPRPACSNPHTAAPFQPFLPPDLHGLVWQAAQPARLLPLHRRRHGGLGRALPGNRLACWPPLPPSPWLTHAQPTNGLLKTRHPMQGVIQSTASEATLVALLAAKARAMQGRPAEDAHKVVAYCSDQAHSSGEGVEGDAGGWWLLLHAALDGVPCRTPVAVIQPTLAPDPAPPPTTSAPCAPQSRRRRWWRGCTTCACCPPTPKMATRCSQTRWRRPFKPTWRRACCPASWWPPLAPRGRAPLTRCQRWRRWRSGTASGACSCCEAGAVRVHPGMWASVLAWAAAAGHGLLS